MYPSGSKLDDPLESLNRLCERLAPVPEMLVPLNEAGGMVLAQDIFADRDHPPIDISAVDGYAMRLDQATVGSHAVTGESRIGSAPPHWSPEGVVKIATGAPVPEHAQAVVKREDVRESPDSIEITHPMALKADQDIRRCGTNIRGGQQLLERGLQLGPSRMSALASMGVVRARVHRPVRVSMIVTGDELVETASNPQPWQIRESHSAAVRCAFAPATWIQIVRITIVRDDFPLIFQTLSAALAESDAVLLSGGVSMGDRDFVPDAVRKTGGEIIFHGLALQPGRPMLGAVAPGGKPVFGLPGNPLSVLVTLRRLGAIALRKLAGFSQIDPPAPRVPIEGTFGASKTFRLFPPASLTLDGHAKIVAANNSGDLITAGRTDGFVEIPPGEFLPASVSFYPWALT